MRSIFLRTHARTHARQEFEKQSITNRVQVARMWIYAVIVEHSVMLSRVCILVFFPVYPEWIGDAKDVLRFRVGEMKKLSRARREQELVRCHATPRHPISSRAAAVEQQGQGFLLAS